VRFTKDPQAVADYKLDWSQWLPTNDTIANSTFTVVDPGAQGVVVDDTAFTSTTATVWLSGGLAGVRYTVTNHIVTAGGREDDRSLRITVKEL